MENGWGELAPFERLVNVEKIEPRAYQINIIKSIFNGKNTLVILPTGLGKTLIGIFAIAKAIHSGKKALILAPTRPLGEQHYNSIIRLLNIEEDLILLLTGSTNAIKRKEMEESASIIVATPQTISNDLKNGKMSIDDFGIVIFDECHRSVGKYAYTYIADDCKEHNVQILGLTASPGSDKKKISEIVTTLGIKNIEIRTQSDPDVAPYVMDNETEVSYVSKGPIVESIASLIKPVIDQHLERLFKMGISGFRHFEHMPKSKLLEIGRNIDGIEAKNYKFAALFDYVFVLDLAHAYDLVCSEGLYPFLRYFESLDERETKSNSVKKILANEEVVKALNIAKSALEKGEEHPKMFDVIRIIKNDLKGKSVIVFAQYRSTIKKIADMLNNNDVKTMPFMGRKEGITQERQKMIIEEFRDKKFDVLAATSIGEEGLDIPAVDAVIFYEPIPSEIRNIQRRGRAGRIKFGKVIIMVAKGTKDEMYLSVSRMREKKMKDIVMKMKSQMESENYKARSPRISNDAGQQKFL